MTTTNYTTVEVWASDIVKYRDDGANNRRVPVVRFSPPKQVGPAFQLQEGDRLEIGRPTKNITDGYTRLDVPDAHKAFSRNSFLITERADATQVRTKQRGGCHIQWWGHATARALRMNENFFVTTDPTSFRVDCSGPLERGQTTSHEQAVWVLVHPGRVHRLPPTSPNYVPGELETGLTAGEDTTDEYFFPKVVPGTKAHKEYLAALELIEWHFSDLLEWPPRFEPSASRPGLAGERQKVLLFRHALTQVGHHVDADAIRALPDSFLQWIVAHNMLSFHDHRQDSRLGSLD